MIEITTFINCFTFDDESLLSIIERVSSLKASFEASVIKHREDLSVMKFVIKKLNEIENYISENLENAIKISKDYDADMNHLISTYSQLASIVGAEIRFCQDFIQVNPTLEDTIFQEDEDNNIEKTLFQKLQSLYGETMSVKQLSEFFQVQPRTITNWENAGFIENISETSGEYKSDGHRKRGKSKRYLTSKVAKIVELQQKYNKLL